MLLSKLEARFHNAGYENVKFFIVTRNETNAERIRNVSRQLEVVTVNDTQSGPFSELEDRSAYIFDRCGRNVYVIHYPFSSVQKPFVKAAVLSTIYDQPCGDCPTNNSDDEEEITEMEGNTAETTTTIDPNLFALLQNSGQLSPLYNNDDSSRIFQPTNFSNVEQVTVTPTFAIDHGRNANEIFKFNPALSTGIDADRIENDSASDAPYVIPLKIILPVDHVHKSTINNSFVRYNYILLKVDDIAYHEHIPSDNSEILFPVDNRQISNPTETETEQPTFVPDSDNGHEATTTIVTETATANVFDINENEHEHATNSVQNDIVLVDSQGYRYELTKHIKIMDEFETNVVEFDSIAMIRPKVVSTFNANQPTKRILNDDDEQQQIDHENNDINVSQYERHYAKIFQWLHYHL